MGFSGSFGDVLILVNTSADESAATVVAGLVEAINLDPILSAAGVTATANGAEVSSDGAITSISIDDPGLSLRASPVPTLSPWAVAALGLILLATAWAVLRRRAPYT